MPEHAAALSLAGPPWPTPPVSNKPALAEITRCKAESISPLTNRYANGT